MNINCIICSDHLQPNSDAFATPCGHVFHHACVMQWLERSKSCPQCRCKVTSKSIYKLFFNVSEVQGDVEDTVVLIGKLDNLQFQLRMNNKDISSLKEKNAQYKNEGVLLREEIRRIENKVPLLEETIRTLRDKIQVCKRRIKDLELLEEENKKLNSKITNYKNIELLISGNMEKVRDMLRYNRDAESLNLMVYTLKKELIENKTKQQEQEKRHNEMKLSLSSLRKELVKIKEENYVLRDSVANYIVKDKPSPNLRPETEVKASTSPNLLVVSKTPQKQTERVSGVGCMSPFPCQLAIKSSSVGLAALMTPKAPSKTMNFPGNLLEKDMKVRPEYCYDGLGGHSKESRFPVPRPIAGIKRHQPSSSGASGKPKRLAPNKKPFE